MIHVRLLIERDQHCRRQQGNAAPFREQGGPHYHRFDI